LYIYFIIYIHKVFFNRLIQHTYFEQKYQAFTPGNNKDQASKTWSFQ